MKSKLKVLLFKHEVGDTNNEVYVLAKGSFGNPIPCGVTGRFPAEIFHEVFLGSIWKPAMRGFLTRSSLFFTRNRARPTEVG